MVVDVSDELVIDLKLIPPRTVIEELFGPATVVLVESVTVYVLSPEALRLIAIDSAKPMDLRMLEVAVVLNSVDSPLGGITLVTTPRLETSILDVSVADEDEGSLLLPSYVYDLDEVSLSSPSEVTLVSRPDESYEYFSSVVPIGVVGRDALLSLVTGV